MNGGHLNRKHISYGCPYPRFIPDLLIDLGGHTADNHPALLSHRLAKVQATYLAFMDQATLHAVIGG